MWLNWLIKIVVLLMLAIVIFNLAQAFRQMLFPKKDKAPMSHFIGRRLIFSAALLILIVVLAALGLVQPNPSPLH